VKAGGAALPVIWCHLHSRHIENLRQFRTASPPVRISRAIEKAGGPLAPAFAADTGPHRHGMLLAQTKSENHAATATPAKKSGRGNIGKPLLRARGAVRRGPLPCYKTIMAEKDNNNASRGEIIRLTARCKAAG
jgi:hypothetical protein